jgi:hypothetical protein
MRNMINKYNIIFLCFLTILLISGCTENISVKGKVTYTDGKHLEFGTVQFHSETTTYTGNIDANGNYIMGAGGNRKGIKKDVYKVTVAAATNDQFGFPIPLIAPQYALTETSGLICDVEEATTFDIIVEKATERLNQKTEKINRQK